MKKEICKNCTYYAAYYKQWSEGYSKLNNDFCSKFQKPQSQFEYCTDFKSNEEKEEMRAERRLKSLDQALTSIIEIAQILKEKEKD